MSMRCSSDGSNEYISPLLRGAVRPTPLSNGVPVGTLRGDQSWRSLERTVEVHLDRAVRGLHSYQAQERSIGIHADRSLCGLHSWHAWERAIRERPGMAGGAERGRRAALELVQVLDRDTPSRRQILDVRPGLLQCQEHVIAGYPGEEVPADLGNGARLRAQVGDPAPAP